MRIIINADDFGYNEEVNYAIADAFSRGYITNTTIMTNMGGALHAVKLAKSLAFFDKVGLHLNLFEGRPLTDLIKGDPYFADEGDMTSYKIFHQLSPIYKFYLPQSTRIAIEKECRAQMERYKLFGFPEKHLDSHGHSHTILSVFKIVKSVNKDFKFRTIRLSLNLYLKRKLPIRIYKRLYNRFLREHFVVTDFFTSAAEFIEVAKSFTNSDGVVEWPSRFAKCTCEIMVHPVYDEEKKLVNHGGPDFEELMPYLAGSELISYKEYD